MVQVFDQKEEMFVHAAEHFVNAAQAAIEEKGSFIVALTGGSSPIAIHTLLAQNEFKSKIDWSKVFVFWADERWVPLEDDKSNAKMAYDTLLNHVDIPAQNIFPMYKAGVSATEYAIEYESFIKNVAPEGVLDLILLGMGDDGHTASLFPHQAIIHEQEKWVDAYYLEAQSMYRITLTAPLINKAKEVQFYIFGEGKAPALYEVLEGTYNPDQYPSQLIKPSSGKLSFLLDKAAASNLTK